MISSLETGIRLSKFHDPRLGWMNLMRSSFLDIPEIGDQNFRANESRFGPDTVQRQENHVRLRSEQMRL
jgi:hypothetical protein